MGAPPPQPGRAPAYYGAPVHGFLGQSPAEILGSLAAANTFDLDPSQRDAWQREIGILQSESKANRLKPEAIDVRVNIDPVHFLNDAADTRSSYNLKDAATEFQVQGLPRASRVAPAQRFCSACSETVTENAGRSDIVPSSRFRLPITHARQANHA